MIHTATFEIIGILGQPTSKNYGEGKSFLILPVKVIELWEDEVKTSVYEVQVWSKKVREKAEAVKEGSLVRITGKIESKAWEANGKSGVNVSLSALAVHAQTNQAKPMTDRKPPCDDTDLPF